jgi:hypothetical protein
LWTIVRAHQSDIGGATHGAYNPSATEIWQEGLRVPPIKLYEAGRLRDDLLDMLALNIRNPREFRGDLAAMVGAAHLGERRLSRLFAEFGASVVEAAVETILDTAEARSRAVVSTWKDGVFRGEAFLDDDGHGRSDIRIAAKVTKKGSDIEVDLSDSDPQSTSFVNSSHANMQAAVAMAFAYLIDADIPKNERDRRSDHQGDVGLLPGSGNGGLGPAFPDCDPGRESAHGAQFYLAHVSGTTGRRGLIRWRRLVVDRRMALGWRDQVRKHRGRRGALSTAFQAP